MDHIQTVFILLFSAVLLVGVAQKFHLPYPIALVLGGGALGFVPGLGDVYLRPDLILPLVLPPILYYSAFGLAFREFKRNWKQIFSMALGLVVFTTLLAGCLFKWMFPEYPWALAMAFGAIVAPPDAIAVTAILKRFGVNSRLSSLLEGESLINDASAIILYNIAVSALLTGSFSWSQGGVEFSRNVLGGIGLGFVLGFALQYFSKHYLEPILGVVFSFTIPYITYICAMFLGVSGVLAVVVNGLIGARFLLTHHSSLRRVVGYAAWDTFIILLNCFVFILLGLQLGSITESMTLSEIYLYSFYAVAIVAAMCLLRMGWVYGFALRDYFTKRSEGKFQEASAILQESAIVGWSGMRGIVSLAIALALPLTLLSGAPIVGRNVVVFMTFVVIVTTLVVPGLSLPFLLRLLNVPKATSSDGEKKIRHQLAKEAEDQLISLLNTFKINQSEFEFLKTYFSSQHRVLEMAHSAEKRMHHFESARLTVIQSLRTRLIEMWEQQEIDDHLLTHLENELDIVEVHIARAELSP